jgi:hypothetical protein
LRAETHEAGRQDFGNFSQALGGAHVTRVEGIHRNRPRYGFRMRST